MDPLEKVFPPDLLQRLAYLAVGETYLLTAVRIRQEDQLNVLKATEDG